MLGSIGPTELILLLLIALIGGGSFFAYRWSKKRSERASFGKPMKWYYFYTYWRLPLGILLSLIFLVSLKDRVELVIGCLIIAFQIAVFIGLKNFKAWGINLNVVLLLLESYSRAATGAGTELHQGTELWVRTGIVLLIWFVPNLVYFERRRRLFSMKGTSGPADTDAESGSQDRKGESGGAGGPQV